MANNVKTMMGIAAANIKTVNGIAAASVKTIMSEALELSVDPSFTTTYRDVEFSGSAIDDDRNGEVVSCYDQTTTLYMFNTAIQVVVEQQL